MREKKTGRENATKEKAKEKEKRKQMQQKKIKECTLM